MALRISRTVFSALSGMRLLACLIVAPGQGYDEPGFLSYKIKPFCPTSAHGLHVTRATFRRGPWGVEGMDFPVQNQTAPFGAVSGGLVRCSATRTTAFREAWQKLLFAGGDSVSNCGMQGVVI